MSVEVFAPAGAARPYAPLSRRALSARRALMLVIAVNVLALLAGFAHYRLLQEATSGLVTEAQLDRSEIRMGLIAIGQVVFFVAAGVCFLRWFHRAYANLPSLGAEPLRFRRGWAIGAWFVPILNAFRPKQIANDIWRASDPGRSIDDGQSWRRDKVPALLSSWWGAFLLLGPLEQLAVRMDSRATDLAGLKNASIVFLVSDALAIVAAVLAILVIARTTERQEERASRVEGARRLREQALQWGASTPATW